jgi:hypothetical protein
MGITVCSIDTRRPYLINALYLNRGQRKLPKAEWDKLYAELQEMERCKVQERIEFKRYR